MEPTKIKFKDTGFGKFLKGFSLIISVFMLSSVLFLYNASTVLNEKNIKKIGEKVVSDFLDMNRDLISDNFADISSYAKQYPTEDMKLPTGIENLKINLKGYDIQNLTEEEFFNTMPRKIVDNIYDETISTILKDNADNKVNSYIDQTILKENSGPLGVSFATSLIILLLSLTIYFILSNKRKFIATLGIMLAATSLPIYLTLYLTTPFVNSVFRGMNIFMAGNMVGDLIGEIQRNYFYIFVLGMALIGIGLIIQANIKELIPKKRGQYEKVIKVKE